MLVAAAIVIFVVLAHTLIPVPDTIWWCRYGERRPCDHVSATRLHLDDGHLRFGGFYYIWPVWWDTEGPSLYLKQGLRTHLYLAMM